MDINVYFQVDCDPQDADGKIFKAGTVAKLNPASARHWIRRNMAVEVTAKQATQIRKDNKEAAKKAKDDSEKKEKKAAEAKERAEKEAEKKAKEKEKAAKDKDKEKK